MDGFEAILKAEFWEGVSELPPLLRMGYSGGPGAFILSEPWDTRRCAVTGKDDYTYGVYVVLKGADGASQFFRHREPLTLFEFKALCDRIMPGVGVCGFRWGAELLDEQGNLRGDLEFPIRIWR
jgi:hypothetical protein